MAYRLTFTALDGVRALHTADADRSCPRDTDGTVRGSALGVPERGDGVDASGGVRRGAARRRDRSWAPFLTFHQCSAKTDPDAVRNGSK